MSIFHPEQRNKSRATYCKPPHMSPQTSIQPPDVLVSQTTRATMGLRWEPPRRYRDIRRSKSRGATGELPSYSGMNKEASPDKADMFLWHTTACLTGTPTAVPGTVVPLLAKALLSDWRYDLSQPIVDEDGIHNTIERTNKKASLNRAVMLLWHTTALITGRPLLWSRSTFFWRKVFLSD